MRLAILTSKQNLLAQPVDYFYREGEGEDKRFWKKEELRENLKDCVLWLEYAQMFRNNKIVFSVQEYWNFPNTHWETIKTINSIIEEVNK